LNYPVNPQGKLGGAKQHLEIQITQLRDKITQFFLLGNGFSWVSGGFSVKYAIEVLR